MSVAIPRESVETLQATVTAKTDPTSATPEWAFTTDADRPSAWTAGTWDGTATLVNGVYVATPKTPMLGTGGLDLTPGDYTVWLRFTSGGNTWVRDMNRLRIT